MLITIAILIATAVAAPSTKPATRPTTTAVAPQRRSFDEAKRVHEQANAKALEDFLHAHLAAKKAFESDLNLAITVAMRAGNLDQANDAKLLREEVARDIEQLTDCLKSSPPIPAGMWDVIYSTGATHTCRISPDGRWEKVGATESTTGRVRPGDHGDWIVNYRDGDESKAERLTLTTNGLLVVEHFNPAEQLRSGAPSAYGLGRPSVSRKLSPPAP